MANGYSAEDLLDFLTHAADRGLLPAATAQALAVGCRNVFQVLNDVERGDLRTLKLDETIKRFNNKRARDFSPASLKEYGHRLHRALDLFLQWKNDPANFSVKTRATKAAGKRDRQGSPSVSPSRELSNMVPTERPRREGGYQTSFPIRPGLVVTLSNVPEDLTRAEAERLAGFVRMLAVE